VTFALIPACGKSTRMGRPKLALSLGGRTVLASVIAALRTAGIEHILVVTGPHVPELVPIAEQEGADVLLLGKETPDMRATVEHGLRWLEDRFHPRDQDDWLLIPADHPTLDAAVISQLLAARAAHPDRSIVVPTHHGRRGHPALIAWQHVAAIRAFPPGLGLNAYLRSQHQETLEMPVENPHILLDLDTPEDYDRYLTKA
jgi:molybdenum cofactor cytidylyltransferase